MGDGFDEKKGLINVLKRVIPTGAFATAVLNLLLGKEGAAEELKYVLKRGSYDNSLNEVVAIHRLLKNSLNEDMFESGQKKDKSLMRKLIEIPHKSMKFQSEVMVKTFRKPGTIMALIRLVKTKGKDAAALELLTSAVIESAVEVSHEDEEFSQGFLSEGIETNGNSVNIMVGRFQPFTLGHLKCLQAIKNALGIPTLLCVIPGNGDEKHPFMGDVQDEMFERLKSAYPDLFADVRYVKNAFIESWALIAKEEGFEPVSWTCGTDRKEAYQNMIDKHGQKYGLSPDFRVFCLDRADDNISATSVRECLLNDDREGFMAQMPACLNSMYDELRNAMTGKSAPSLSVAAIRESKAFSDFRKSLDEGLRNLLK